MSNLRERVLERLLKRYEESVWVLIPGSDIPTRIYLAATFFLFVAAAIYFMITSGDPFSSVTVLPYTVWGISALLLALFHIWAFFDLRYVVFRSQAIITLTWSMAYEVDLIYGSVRSEQIAIRLILWTWIVVIHILMTRYRLALVTATRVPPKVAATIPDDIERKVERLQELVDPERDVNESSTHT